MLRRLMEKLGIYICVRRKKVANEDIEIIHNNIMLEMDPAIIDWFRNKAIQELKEMKEKETITVIFSPKGTMI